MSPIVLIVEDEGLLRLALAEHLDSCGFEVREAEDAASAMRILAAPDCLINLVISDVRMPGAVDGLDLYWWIARQRPGLPVILATGDRSMAETVKALCGSHAMLKPYDFDQATHKILDLVSSRPPL